MGNEESVNAVDSVKRREPHLNSSINYENTSTELPMEGRKEKGKIIF